MVSELVAQLCFSLSREVIVAARPAIYNQTKPSGSPWWNSSYGLTPKKWT
jgi:hypothetical protein